jgi:hypothetical protein
MTGKPTSRDLLVTNPEFKLPDIFSKIPSGDPSHPTVNFVPTEILHILLGMEPDPNNGQHYIFNAFRKTEAITADPWVQAENYAEAQHKPNLNIGKLHSKKSPYKHSKFSRIPNPYDIVVKEQCILILELDQRINWCFTRGSLGVTTKDFYSDHSFGVRFVDSTGTALPVGSKAPEKHSRILFFAIAERHADTRESFNFHIEFVWKNLIFDEFRLPTIFDPDIPNTGSGSIP